MKCQALRVVIIDEVSMISADLFGTLEYVVTQAVRVTNTYKKRQGDKEHPIRAFGGVNIIMCGDFWQLHPVSGTFLASDPSVGSAGRTRNALEMFWCNGIDCIRSYWPLVKVMRCADIWYNSFLKKNS